MVTTWVEITCTVPAAIADDFAAYVVELSGNGVTMDNRVLDTFSLDTLEEQSTSTIMGYLVPDAALDEKIAAITAYLSARSSEFPGFAMQAPSIATIGEEDWANNWKQHFRPTRIGTRLILKPTWEEFNASEGDIIIELDPGMAFGTGTHPTTRLCLEIMEAIFLRRPPFGSLPKATPEDILDVGTGSGILAIAAAKCGARRVVAIDIDPRAVSVAADNIALNNVSGIVNSSDTPLHEVTGTYQIVLANILAEELVRLGNELTERVAPGGFLILSGILSEREGFVLQGFSRYPLSLVVSLSEAEWCVLCFQRNP